MSQMEKSITMRMDTGLFGKISDAIKRTPEYSTEREFYESAVREKLDKFRGQK